MALLTADYTTKEDRAEWKQGSTVEVFVTNRQKWYSATVTDISTDGDEEWMLVSIQNKIIFELRRSDKFLRRIKTAEELAAEKEERDRMAKERAEKEESEKALHQQQRLEMLSKLSAEHKDDTKQKGKENEEEEEEEDESDGDLSSDYYTASDDDSSVSSSSSSSSPSVSSMDSLNSTDSEFDGVIDSKYRDEKVEDPALIVIIVDRGGTESVNGKYLYRGEQRGKGLWQKEGDSKSKLYWKYDNIWTLEYDTNDLYIAFTTRHLPPSSGWQPVDDAKHPSPSVVLHRLNQIETVRNYLSGKGGNEEEEDTTTSPLDFIEIDFEIPDDYKNLSILDALGFSVKLNESTGLLYVDELVADGQADELEVKIGDIISTVESNDISLIGHETKFYQHLKTEMDRIFQESADSGGDLALLEMQFGRQKSTFPVVVLQRSGCPEVDGKYSIKERQRNNAWRFVQNEDGHTEITQIYCDSDEDEAVWVVRRESDDAQNSNDHNGDNDGDHHHNNTANKGENEQERRRRVEEEERVKREQLERERAAKIVDERWLFPILKEAQFGDIVGSDSVSRCTLKRFMEYFVTEKSVHSEIAEIIFKAIDSKQKGTITTAQHFSFKTSFTVERMRTLLPEHCPPPQSVLKSQRATAERKKANLESLEKVQNGSAKKGDTPSTTSTSTVDKKEVTSIQELEGLRFMELKALCKTHKLPLNGTKTQLFMKLRECLFPPQNGRARADGIGSGGGGGDGDGDERKDKEEEEVVAPLNMSTEFDARTDLSFKDSTSYTFRVTNQSQSIFSGSSSAYADSLNSADSSGTDSDDVGVRRRGAFKDYYVALSGHSEVIPPNYGWEAMEPNGIWPAPGLTVYDIELSTQNLQRPVIERVVPGPQTATIYFECASPRVPTVCKHLESWFEVEVVPHRNDDDHDQSNEEQKSMDRENVERRVIRCESSPAVFTGLTNGVESTYSEPSEPVTPLKLPSKPRFTNIEATATELALYWECDHFSDHEVMATVTLRTSPLVPVPDGLTVNDDGEIVLNDGDTDGRCVRLQGLSTGTDYILQLRASNAVGSMECEPESAAPCNPPPQPVINAVFGGNREIILDVECEGWTDAATKCWFECDISPNLPTLDWLHHELYASKRSKSSAKPQRSMNSIDSHWRNQSTATMNRLQSAKQKSRGGLTGFSILSQMDLLSLQSTIDEEESDNDDDHHLMNDGDDGMETKDIPLYRRQKRYHSLPIVIGPAINGEEYTVTVNARNYAGIRSSSPSDFVTPIGIPPQPTIRSVKSLDGELRVEFECDDWSTLEYRAMFEMVTMPKTTRTKTRRLTMKVRNLENGQKYRLKVRGINSIGKGPWSTESAESVPLKLPLDIEAVRMVPGNGEVSLFWVSDDVERGEYEGWYEVSSRPSSGYTVITKRQQTTFRGLENGKAYRFRICAVNVVGKSNKFETEKIKPHGKVASKLYQDLRRKTAQNVDQLRSTYYQRIRAKDKRKENELGGDRRKKGKVITTKRLFKFGADSESKMDDDDDDEKVKMDRKWRESKKEKKRKKKKEDGIGVSLSDFASMIEKQQNREQKGKAKGSGGKSRDKGQQMKEKEMLLSRTRKTSIMDVNRVDTFGSIFRPKKM